MEPGGPPWGTIEVSATMKKALSLATTSLVLAGDGTQGKDDLNKCGRCSFRAAGSSLLGALLVISSFLNWAWKGLEATVSVILLKQE